MSSRSATINPIARSEMDAQFGHALAHRFCISKVAGLDLAKPDYDTSLRHLVAETVKPRRKWLSSVFGLITDEFDHRLSVA